MEGFIMNIMTSFWIDFFQSDTENHDWWARKIELWKKREAEIVRINGNGHVFQKKQYDDQQHYQYLLHLSFLVRQKDYFYVEEAVMPYQFQMRGGKIVEHQEVRQQSNNIPDISQIIQGNRHSSKRNRQFSYDRLAAVKYAEHWWNSYNPTYKKFDVDCTNYISQCLRAGGAPMRGAPNRNKGWWYQGNNWSFSWAVAHSLRWYLSGSTEGLQGKEVESASDLYLGDVICYDFQGDGRWDHNTIVVAKDANDMPLVNAHTDNSRHRYWSYEDSTAWTPQIQYKFFQIGK
jgi:hypothetical protein